MPNWTLRFVPFFFSALGMLAGQWLGRYVSLPAAAASEPPTTAPASGNVSASSFELVDEAGRRRIFMATSREGSPGMWFYDSNGKVRLSLGLYGDDNAFIVLNDDQERAVQIFRTMGPRSAPFLVMKAEGRDRIVMGLTGTVLDPFLVYYEPNGQKQTVFGSWP